MPLKGLYIKKFGTEINLRRYYGLHIYSDKKEFQPIDLYHRNQDTIDDWHEVL